jgi:hypothetical protein
MSLLLLKKTFSKLLVQDLKAIKIKKLKKCVIFWSLELRLAGKK